MTLNKGDLVKLNIPGNDHIMIVNSVDASKDLVTCIWPLYETSLLHSDTGERSERVYGYRAERFATAALAKMEPVTTASKS